MKRYQYLDRDDQMKFSQSKSSRRAKLMLKQLLYRIALPKGLSSKEMRSINEIVDYIIDASISKQVESFSELRTEMNNILGETLQEFRKEILEEVKKCLPINPLE